MLNPMRRLSLMSQTKFETTLTHPFTDYDACPDTDAFYQTLVDKIEELIEIANLHEASVCLTYDEEKTKLVLSVS